MDQGFFIPSLHTIESLAAFSVGTVAPGKLGKVGVEGPAVSDPSAQQSEETTAKPKRVRRRKNPEEPPPKRGRKLDQEEPADKRVAQNRVAQRAFRERRVNQMLELQNKVKELTEVIEARAAEGVDMCEYLALKQRVTQVEAENQLLRQVAFGNIASLTASSPSLITPPGSNLSPNNLDVLQSLPQEFDSVALPAHQNASLSGAGYDSTNGLVSPSSNEYLGVMDNFIAAPNSGQVSEPFNLFQEYGIGSLL